MYLVVFSRTAETSSISVMQLPEKHDHQQYWGESKKLQRPTSMLVPVYLFTATSQLSSCISSTFTHYTLKLHGAWWDGQ